MSIPPHPAETWHQPNAHLPDALQVRVGLPLRNGRMPGHAFDQGYPALVSAAAFWDGRRRAFVENDGPLSDLDWALDSAGFTAMSGWAKKGPQPGLAGIFPWTLAQYLGLVLTARPRWWSAPDLCCEPQVAADRAMVDWRVRATATLLHATLEHVARWQDDLGGTGAALLPPPVPILQGWRPDDYRRSLDMTLDVWSRWQPLFAAPVLLGVGSVCRRDLHHPEHGLYAVLDAIDRDLPAGARLHLFGVKGAAIPALAQRPCIASVDSQAWDLRARMQAREERRSNTLDQRLAAMDAWMTRHAALAQRGAIRSRATARYAG